MGRKANQNPESGKSPESVGNPIDQSANGTESGIGETAQGNGDFQQAPDLGNGTASESQTPQNGQGGPDTGEQTRKRRGRPPGSKSKSPGSGTAQKGIPAYLKPEVIANQLLGVHAIAAKVTGIRELELSAPEAGMLATQISEVASLYDIPVNDKIMAWVGLLSVAVVVYSPRLVAIRARRIKEEQEAMRQAHSGEPPKTPQQAQV